MMAATGLGELASTAGVSALLSLPLITVYLLYAAGIVVIYRASRVLNLAHGAMAAAPAYVYYSLAQAGLPRLVAAVLAVAAGAALGMAVERFVVRRLRRQGPTAQTVGTLAVFGLVVALLAKVYGTTPLVPPPLFPEGVVIVGASGIRYGQIITFALGVAVTVGLFALFRFTGLGLAMRASADNRRGAALMGIDTDRTTAAAWALGGGMAGLAGVLVSALSNLHPYTLSLQVLPAFVAVLIGGLTSLLGAIVGAAVVGLVQGLVPAFALLPGLGELADTVGFAQLVLLILTFVVMGLRGRRLIGSQVRDPALVEEKSAGAAGPSEFARAWARPGGLVAALVVVLLPFLPIVPFSVLTDVVLACYYLLVALSLVLLTGWVGQISLAQAAFVGVGAFTTALLVNHANVGFPLNLPVAAVAGGFAAAVLGLVALRVRGMYLAVATLVFAWTADSFLFHQSWFGVQGGSATIAVEPLGDPEALPYFDFTNITLIYLVFVAVAVLALYGLANLRESKTGRALFAVRGSEVAAASLGVNVMRYKLLAFALAGGIAGMAGNVLMVYSRSLTPDSVTVLSSLFFLAIVVVGGLTSLGGTIAAAIVFAGLNELFFRVEAFAGFLDIVAAGLLLAVLLGYPGGLAALPGDLARWWQARQVRQARRQATMAAEPARARAVTSLVARAVAPLGRAAARLPLPGVLAGRAARSTRAVRRVRLPSGPAEDALARLNGHRADATDRAPEEPAAAEAEPVWAGFEPTCRMLDGQTRPDETALLVAGASVAFGGLKAVDDATLEVREGEIVGLIGANGAGKTTLFNVVSGLLTPVAGTVELLGNDVTGFDVHQRAGLGLGRTFQDIQLFAQLDVFDNLLVATHQRNPSRLAGHIMVSGRALAAERAARERVDTVLDFLGLHELAHRGIGDLSFGLLRLVEVARALVTGSRLLLLDEPASGLDNAESDRLAQLLLYVREQLGISMLVVEHDVRTVVGLSDYLYVLDRGRIIADGRPAEVRASAAVQEAYLGADTMEVVS